jgi:hypothetical protein
VLKSTVGLGAAGCGVGRLASAHAAWCHLAGEEESE